MSTWGIHNNARDMTRIMLHLVPLLICKSLRIKNGTATHMKSVRHPKAVSVFSLDPLPA